MNNTALGLLVAITLLLSHLYLETKTTNIVDSLEVASVKFLNTLTERQQRAVAAGAPAAPAAPVARTAGEVRGARA